MGGGWLAEESKEERKTRGNFLKGLPVGSNAAEGFRWKVRSDLCIWQHMIVGDLDCAVVASGGQVGICSRLGSKEVQIWKS